MNCNRNEKLLSAYLDRELDGQTQLQVREHIRLCPTCAQQLEELRELKSQLGALREVTPPEGSFERLKARLDNQVRAESRENRFLSAGIVAAAACAAVLAWTWTQSQTPTTASAQPMTEKVDLMADQVQTVGAINVDQSVNSPDDPIAVNLP